MAEMNASIRGPRGALAVLIVLLVTGTSTGQAQTRSAQTFEWRGPIAAGATLEVKGVNGPVRAVRGSGSSAVIRATRTGRRNDPNEVEIVVLEHSRGVTVCAVYPSNRMQRNECRPGREGSIGARNNDVQVSFTVEVPAHAALVARTTNGAVTAEDLGGAVEGHTTNGEIRIDGGTRAVARTTNGSVTIRTGGTAEASTTNGNINAQLSRLTGETPMSFSTTNGSITLTIPDGASATVDASTTNGRIHSDFPVTVHGTMSRSRLSGAIGNGGDTLHLRTTNGGIRLQRAS
jgi:hypothetical protein